MLRILVRALLSLLFRVEIRGLEHYEEAGERVLLVSNTGSLLDPLFMAAMLPGKLSLVINSSVARKWWMRPFLALNHCIVIDFSSPIATRELIKAVEKHKKCMVFHTAAFTYNPYFMRVLEATGLIAEKANARILPVRIDGAQYSHFSYFRYKMRLRWFPKVTLTVLPPQQLETPAGLPRDRRRQVALQLYGVMTELLYHTSPIDKNVLQCLSDAVAIFGRSRIIAEDQDRVTISYGNLLTKVQVLGRAFGRFFAGEERVGFLLPNSLAAVVGFLGLHVRGKIPAMLNFSSGPATVLSTCRTVQLKSVLTSRKFIKLADLGLLEKTLAEAGLRIVYMEDIATRLTLGDKLGGLLASRLRLAPSTPAESPLAILFTSGSEGQPKAVFMSHRNANANRWQVLSIISITAGDRFFNSLPMFHTFGLGVGTLLPVLSGMRLLLYPSPLHYRQVPQLFYESLSTIICGTDTFFTGYARYGQPYDFFNARYVIAGAEKLRDSTAAAWQSQYGVTILQGYGATETSPVISVNTPMNSRYGSVGRPLPGIECRLRPVQGVEGGVLTVKGDNIMLGYMRAEKPGVLEPPADGGPGWYDTGDIVTMDAEDFIFISGRAKRFAKIGGEMVSLAAVESALQNLWPETHLAVVGLPDARKGEQLVLVIQDFQPSPGQIATYFAGKGLPALWTPKVIFDVKAMPLLGSGKTDYAGVQELARQELAKLEQAKTALRKK